MLFRSGTKWAFRNKQDEHGVVTRNKARLVAKGYSQVEGLDFGETYVSAFRDRGGGSLGRRVNCRRVPQPRWVGARRSAKGGKGIRREREVEIPRPSCSSRAQVGCACSRGLQAFHAGGSKQPHASASPVLFPVRPTFCKGALVLPFIGARRGSRCTMGV